MLRMGDVRRGWAQVNALTRTVSEPGVTRICTVRAVSEGERPIRTQVCFGWYKDVHSCPDPPRHRNSVDRIYTESHYALGLKTLKF